MLTRQYRNPSPPLFTLEDLEKAFQWICDLRQRYSANSDIWCLRRDWEDIREALLSELNAGTYQFSPLERYEFDDAIISLWSSQDMIVLKLINQALQQRMADDLPKSCYHVKGHGGLKKAVSHTYEALQEHQYCYAQ